MIPGCFPLGFWVSGVPLPHFFSGQKSPAQKKNRQNRLIDLVHWVQDLTGESYWKKKRKPYRTLDVKKSNKKQIYHKQQKNPEWIYLEFCSTLRISWDPPMDGVWPCITEGSGISKPPALRSHDS